MSSQHILFGPGEQLVSRLEPVWFQPIVDTFEDRTFAWECLLQPGGKQGRETGETIEAARVRAQAIHSVASHGRQGLYFFSLVPSSIDDPELDMRSTIEAIFEARMHPGNVVFEVIESDLARDPDHSLSIRNYLRRNGFGFSLGGAGVGAGASSLEAVRDFEPDYINVDKRLIQNMDQPVCASTISKLVQMAENAGACVVAEGVDRVRMMENLWLLGVRFMQGHLFGEPSMRIT